MPPAEPKCGVKMRQLWSMLLELFLCAGCLTAQNLGPATSFVSVQACYSLGSACATGELDAGGSVAQALPATDSFPEPYAVASASPGEVTVGVAGSTYSVAEAQIAYDISVSGCSSGSVVGTFAGTITFTGGINQNPRAAGNPQPGFWLYNVATGSSVQSYTSQSSGYGYHPFAVTASLTCGSVYQVVLAGSLAGEAYIGSAYNGSVCPAACSADITLSISLSSGQLNTSPNPPPVNGKSLGAGCPGACVVGNPIDVGSGNKFESVVDYHTAGSNQLSFARYYNSLASAAPFTAELGTNWNSTFDRHLVLAPNFVIAQGVVTVGAEAVAVVSAYRQTGRC